MSQRLIPAAIATGSFISWLLILYAGADHPVPPGFLWAILLDLIAGVLVYVRVPIYMRWSMTRQPYRLLRVARDGAGVGLAFAAFAVLLPTTGQPGVHPNFWERSIFFSVVAIVGVVGTGVPYLLGALAAKFLPGSLAKSGPGTPG